MPGTQITQPYPDTRMGSGDKGTSVNAGGPQNTPKQFRNPCTQITMIPTQPPLPWWSLGALAFLRNLVNSRTPSEHPASY
ncbi:hypothetical protein FKM82_029813 [Ascaphus truei]